MSYYSVSKRLAKEIPNSWYVNQYDNLANRDAHYETTGPEIWEQSEGKITHLVVATGTGGTVSGTGKYLKEKNPDIKVWAVDSYGSLLTKYFRTGEIDSSQVHPYITEGIGEDFVPENYDMQYVDEFVQVTDKEAAVMARRIAREEGIFVGYSCGSALQGLIQLSETLTKDDVVVVIFHDHGSRYVGKVYNDQWMMERGFLEVKTFKDLVSGRKAQRLISVSPDQTIAEAVAMMEKYDIENIPVMKEGKIIGALSQQGLFNKVFTNPDIKNTAVETALEPPYPVVDFNTPIDRLRMVINKDNGAAIAQDEAGNYHIVTKYDVIKGLGN
jgi:cystathionine beta-synthase